MWIEVLFEGLLEGLKRFSGAIIGAILIAVFWWKFPKLREFVEKSNPKKNNTEEIRQVIKEEFEVHHNSVKPIDAQKMEEMQKQLEAQRQELERVKVTKQRPAMSDSDFLKLCKSGNVRSIEEAVINGVNVNAKNNKGMTALMWIVANGYTEMAEVLLKHGANVNAKNNKGMTALMWAAYNGHAEVAEILIKYGVDVNAKDNLGRTALMWAKMKGNTEMANLLRRYVAEDPAMSDAEFWQLCKSGDARKVEEAIMNGANVNAKINDGWTALMVAAENGCIETAALLLKHGADVNAKNKNGWTALMVTARKGHTETANLLRKYGAK